MGLQCVNPVLRTSRRKTAPTPYPRAQYELICADDQAQARRDAAVNRRQPTHEAMASLLMARQSFSSSCQTIGLGSSSAGPLAKTTRSSALQRGDSLKCSLMMRFSRFLRVALRMFFLATTIPILDCGAGEGIASTKNARVLTRICGALKTPANCCGSESLVVAGNSRMGHL